MNYKDEIIYKIADKACKKISLKVIKNLQKMKGCHLSGDSGLKNIWDEICVQVQGEESIFWDAYNDTIKPLILSEVKDIDEEIKQAIWFQTDEGLCWDEEAEEQDLLLFNLDQITDYIYNDYLWKYAADWTNNQIEKYLIID